MGNSHLHQLRQIMLPRSNISNSTVSKKAPLLILLKVGALLCLPLLVIVVVQNRDSVSEDDWINIALIFLSKPKHPVDGKAIYVGDFDTKKLSNFVENIIDESKGTRLSMYIICRDGDRDVVVRNFAEVVRFAQEHDVQVRFEAVSFESLESQVSPDIEHSRKYYGEIAHIKYYLPNYHFKHVYHKVLPVKKLVALDVDMQFRVSIKELYKQFNNMNSTQMIGVVYDQAPYYRLVFKKYRDKHPGTHLGSPPPGYPGLNTGVLLLDLEKMRKSEDYSFFLGEEGAKILQKYEMEVRIGEQDFYTLLAIEKPELFMIMDCSWNRQMDPAEFILRDFDLYHYCGKGKIYHANGGSHFPPRD